MRFWFLLFVLILTAKTIFLCSCRIVCLEIASRIFLLLFRGLFLCCRYNILLQNRTFSLIPFNFCFIACYSVTLTICFCLSNDLILPSMVTIVILLNPFCNTFPVVILLLTFPGVVIMAVISSTILIFISLV